ncbi:MAG: hypothetical protein KKG00_08785 [Bacteroidetes bacterium]|nr:hypothetical protein [Bacteroidota bacterium]
MKNTRPEAQLLGIQTPVEFELHTIRDTVSRAVRPYRVVKNNQKLYISNTNRLRVGTTDTDVAFASGPVGAGPLSVHVDLKNPDERKTVEAALQAFSEVYSVELNLEEQKTADVHISKVPPEVPRPTTLYVVTGQTGISAHPNIIYTPEPLTPQTSPMVANGQLPEWLGAVYSGTYWIERRYRPHDAGRAKYSVQAHEAHLRGVVSQYPTNLFYRSPRFD